MGDLTTDFSRHEFRCKCGCGLYIHRNELITDLQVLRNRTNIRINVNSGCRCTKHNKDVGGSPSSSHLSGWAADITCADMYTLLEQAFTLFNRIGIAATYIHVDIDPLKSPRRYWIY